MTVPHDATSAAPLALRQSDAVSMFFVGKVFLLTVVLLLLAYVALRVYVRLRGRDGTERAASLLSREVSVRLSPHARAHLLSVAGKKVLVTESASSVHALLIEDKNNGADNDA